MLASAERFIGKRMSLDEMIKELPNLWVGVSEYKDISKLTFNGKIECVCDTFEDKLKEENKFLREGRDIYWSLIGDDINNGGDLCLLLR